jgi:hypothetical protein
VGGGGKGELANSRWRTFRLNGPGRDYRAPLNQVSSLCPWRGERRKRTHALLGLILAARATWPLIALPS